MFKKVKSFLIHITGDKENFNFRERLFHSLCLIMLFPLIEIIIQNYIFHLYALIIPWFVVLGHLVLCYSLSRYARKFNIAVVLFGVGTSIILLINYYFNDGIDGPTMIGSFIPMILLFSISSNQLKLIWAIMYILIFAVLLYLDFNNPSFIGSYYTSLKHRYFDIYFTYIFSLAFIFLIVWFIQKSLESEQNTTKKQAIELAKERYSLKQANSQLNKLFSIISHDLRKPLGNIISYLDLLDNAVLSDDEKELIKKDLNSNTKNTHQLLENLLNWSRAQENGFRFSPSTITMNELLINPLSISNDLAKSKEINILTSYNPNQIVKVDKSLTNIIIRNLMQNAVKFSPPKSTIKLSAEKVDKELIIQVIDEGPGLRDVDKKQLKKKSNDKSWNSTKNTNGLGLHLCVMCATTHNGRIEAFDNPEGGAIIKVTLSA